MRRAGGLARAGHGAATAAGRATKVMRAAVSAFFAGYHCFTSVAALLALPFSAAVLASEAMAPSSGILRGVAARLRAVFAAAGFPPSPFFALLEAKLSQTVFTFAATLPFALTFLLLAKACVAAMLRDDVDDGHRRRRRLAVAVAKLPPCGAVARAYPAVVATHLLNAFLMLSANAAVFSLLLLAFGAADLLGLTSHFWTLALSAAGAIVYSLAVGVATVVCNLAVVVAATEPGCAGHAAVLRACVAIRGRVSTALALALPTNLGMAAAEALFGLRVVAQRRKDGGRLAPGVAGEAFSIAYIHAICVVLEIIVSCMFYRSCKRSEADELRELEPEEKGDLQA
ncbi:hypothetical protein BDA96_08G155700 [Sorghum bicolor]|uniref:Uncharacterized protein n=2 Tax=Sorghum bicolor TaxID=4558 RepID=A0A921U7N9_SORBI|nr:uncharacterized protein LOC8068127 [Sorghum bicolor]EES16218.1 hypothetical protein SORBI_3008G140800 [Sorghum bicolor]KAG0521383.1 hypothetical protein BDA96_08G155700 [Sorghum bicolor]|eukprot:XP_002442380.1 uncharacterized protein LOC8068127 [Sorghum bicolor]